MSLILMLACASEDEPLITVEEWCESKCVPEDYTYESCIESYTPLFDGEGQESADYYECNFSYRVEHHCDYPWVAYEGDRSDLRVDPCGVCIDEENHYVECS